MKRYLFLFGIVLMAVSAFSNNTLTIHQKDGTQVNFGLADMPVISYTDSDLVIKSSQTEVLYPLALIAKFTFTDVEDGVISIEASSSQLVLDDYMVRISGAKPEITVSVIGADGKTLATHKTDAEGDITFSIAELPEGVYIIKSEEITCKVLKK